MSDKKRIQVSLPEAQWKKLEELKEELGTSDAEIIRNIVVSWMVERGMYDKNKTEDEGR